MNGQAQTFRPRWCSASTRAFENWFQYVLPSELLTKTVEMPCRAASAAIWSTSPPLDFDTYQIHMPSPSKAVPVGWGSVGCGAGGVGVTPPTVCAAAVAGAS